MHLSLPEAATALGKSERQIRYLIKTGRLRAAKSGGHWRIESSDLPLTETQRKALATRLEAARGAFEKGLEPLARAAEPAAAVEKKRQYSVSDLAAFQSGQAIYRDLRGALGEESPPCRHLFAALGLVARGCHLFQPGDKAARFAAARELVAMAVADLLVREDGTGACRSLSERIEQELIPKISGLVALHEKKTRRSRFDRFGGGPPGLGRDR